MPYFWEQKRDCNIGAKYSAGLRLVAGSMRWACRAGSLYARVWRTRSYVWEIDGVLLLRNEVGTGRLRILERVMKEFAAERLRIRRPAMNFTYISDLC